MRGSAVRGALCFALSRSPGREICQSSESACSPGYDAGAQRTAAEFNVGTQETRWHNLSAARHLVWLKFAREMMPERPFVRNALSVCDGTPDEDKGAHGRPLPFELCLTGV
ncbi:hypothetical protein GCM10008942_22700 [Rhizomicrobium electricum]|uniref:Uncharacterized protein n=1 Tax=Rhizomicrobium electricum TaxID=480070 RepID=A0ABP3PRI3_9PROT